MQLKNIRDFFLFQIRFLLLISKRNVFRQHNAIMTFRGIQIPPYRHIKRLYKQCCFFFFAGQTSLFQVKLLDSNNPSSIRINDSSHSLNTDVTREPSFFDGTVPASLYDVNGNCRFHTYFILLVQIICNHQVMRHLAAVTRNFSFTANGCDDHETT